MPSGSTKLLKLTDLCNERSDVPNHLVDQDPPSRNLPYLVPLPGLVGPGSVGPGSVGSVRRSSSGGDPLGGSAISDDVSTALQRRTGGGQSLPATTAALMGAAFGVDFSAVRVHDDKEASTISRSVQAKAFTHGSDIYFSEGTYSPSSSQGQRLLAHELSHVVQGQTAGSGRAIIGKADDPTESAADAMADKVMSSIRRSATSAGDIDGLVGGPTQQTLRRVATDHRPAIDRLSIRRCKTTEEIFKGSTDDKDKKAKLSAYAEHLNERMLDYLNELDIEAPNYDALNKSLSDLLDNLEDIVKGIGLGRDNVEVNSELIEDVTDGFREVKTKVARPVAETKKTDQPQKSTEANFLEISPDPVRAKALGLKGNSNTLKGATKKEISDSAKEIRSLKQDLLNSAKSPAASLRITEIFKNVRQLYIDASAQQTDGQVTDFWTMYRHGLRAALEDASASFAKGLTCNEELAEWLEKFIAKVA